VTPESDRSARGHVTVLHNTHTPIGGLANSLLFLTDGSLGPSEIGIVHKECPGTQSLAPMPHPTPLRSTQSLEAGPRSRRRELRITWETYTYSYDAARDQIVAEPVGKYTQYPLMLAWAVTIHKSQGKTMDNVLVDLGTGAFASGRTYVALSRCRSFEGMRLAGAMRPTDIICDPVVKRFYLVLGEMIDQPT